jgi:GNAT superfamily N-acetyltransferase
VSAPVVAPPRDPAELESACSLLGAILRPERPRSLVEEHPAIFGGAANGELRVLWEEGRPLGGAAIVVREAATPHGKLRLGLIGSVATDPSARGRGVGRAVLASCEASLRDWGCAAALLWADVPRFYERCGYVGAGCELLLVFPHDAPLPPVDGCARSVPEEWDCVERLRRREPARTDRPSAESFAHYGGAATAVFVHRGARGDIDAYAAVGRGADLRGVIHESGGSLFGILALVRHVLAMGSERQVVFLVNPHRHDLVEYAMVRGLELHHGILGMSKVLDAAALCDALEVHLPAGVSVARTQAGARLSRGARQLELADRDLLRAVLGYQGSREPLERIERVLALDAIATLPLSPWMGGYDSI